MQRSPLDDIEKIKEIDKSDMLAFCVKSFKHYNEAAKMEVSLPLKFQEPDNVIIAGMGGSGIGGGMLKDWARDKVPVPIEVNRSFLLPHYAGKRTLVLISSYSGETEESLSALLDALRKECMICCVSSGGTMLKFASKLGLPFFRVPTGMPPRAAFPYLFIPLLKVMEKTSLAPNVSEDLTEGVKVLEKISSENSPKQSSGQNFSKILSLKLNGTIPVIYSFEIYRSVGQRLKQQFNENSKVPSRSEFFPELNHNEIVSWEDSEELADKYSIIMIRDENETPLIRSRIEATKHLLDNRSSRIFEIWSQGESQLARMFSTICIGDFTSVYLAILRKIDPTPVDTIKVLKKKMANQGTKEKIIRELEKLVPNLT